MAEEGIDIRHLSIVGKGYHTDEKGVGFYNMGDRVKFWGKSGAFWGGLWGWFFGGIFPTIPVIGHVVVLGYLTAAVISAVEGAVVVGGLSALGAARCRQATPGPTGFATCPELPLGWSHVAVFGPITVASQRHSRNFDHRRRPNTLQTAMVTGFRRSTNTTNCLPRVPSVYSRLRCSVAQCWVKTGMTTAETPILGSCEW